MQSLKSRQKLMFRTDENETEKISNALSQACVWCLPLSSQSLVALPECTELADEETEDLRWIIGAPSSP